MQRMLCVLMCLALFGCSKSQPSSEENTVVTMDVLLQSERDMKEYVDGHVKESIGKCQSSLAGKIAGIRTEFETHRDEVNAVLKPNDQEPITAELLQRVKKQFQEQDAKELANRSEQSSSNLVAYARQDVAPPPPKDDETRMRVQTAPSFDLARFFVKDKTQNCMIIQDRQFGQWYRWNFQQGSAQLVALYQNGCNCGIHWLAVNVEFKGDRIVFPNRSTVSTPGFPTP